MQARVRGGADRKAIEERRAAGALPGQLTPANPIPNPNPNPDPNPNYYYYYYYGSAPAALRCSIALRSAPPRTRACIRGEGWSWGG